MTGIGVRDVGVDVLIADRRRRDHAVVLRGRRNWLFVVVAGRVLALGNGFFARGAGESRRHGKARAAADKRQDQSQDEHGAEPKHLPSPTVLRGTGGRRHGSGSARGTSGGKLAPATI